MKYTNKYSIQLWILALCAVRVAVAEIRAVANLTVLDVDQLLNVTCTEDADCLDVHFAAHCKVSNIDYDDTRAVIVERQCGCDTTQRFYKGGETCVYHSPILGNCDKDEVTSICEDPNSECRLSSDGSGILSCECIAGTVLVEYNSTKKCAYRIDGQDDSLCELCIFNKGICFDLDQDKKRDGCACPPSFSGENCSIENVRVTCSSGQMTICYTPHAESQIMDGFSLSAYGKLDVPSCRAKRSDAICGEGQYILVLPLQDALLSVCGTEVVKEDGKIKYTSTIVIQTQPEPSRIADKFIHTFCSFTHFHDVSSVGMTVNSYTDTEVGQEILPLLSMSIRNIYGDMLDRDKAYRVGDHVYLNFFLSTENGYSALRVDGCTLSSSDAMPDARADTLRVIDNGCPVPDQKFITNVNNFQRVQGQANELQTGLVQLIKLRTGRSLHIHCTLKLCIKGYDAGCQLVNCQSSRRRRSSVETDSDVMMIDMHGEIKLTEDIRYQAIIKGMTLTSIALAIIVFIILIAVITLIVAQARAAKRKKQKGKMKQVKLVNTRGLFIKTLHNKSIPSHMTESEV